MSDRSRGELYPLHELPENVGVSSSVLEIDRTHLDRKLEKVLGKELTGLLIAPAADKDNYGAQVSIEEDTSWVYIEETWDEGGFEFYRNASTGLNSNDTDISIVVMSPKDENGSTPSRMSIEVRVDDNHEITDVRANGELSARDGRAIPFIDSLLNLDGLDRFAAEAKSHFTRGNISGFRYRSGFTDGNAVAPEVRATNIEKAGNGYLMKRLKLEDGELEYGTKLTNNLLFASVDTVPLEKPAPPPITKIV